MREMRTSAEVTEMEYYRNRVRYFKTFFKISFKTIAAESGISYRTLTHFTCGERDLSDENLDKLKEYFKGKEDWM